MNNIKLNPTTCSESISSNTELVSKPSASILSHTAQVEQGLCLKWQRSALIHFTVYAAVTTWACWWSAIICVHFLNSERICTWYDNSVNNKVWQTALWCASSEDNIRQSSKLARLSVPKAAEPFAKENMTCARRWVHNAAWEMSVQEVNLQSQQWSAAVDREAETERTKSPPTPWQTLYDVYNPYWIRSIIKIMWSLEQRLLSTDQNEQQAPADRRWWWWWGGGRCVSLRYTHCDTLLLSVRSLITIMYHRVQTNQHVFIPWEPNLRL